MAIQLRTSQIKDLNITTGKLAANAVTAAKMDLSTSQTFDFSTAGVTVLVGTPTIDAQAATKAYVDNTVNGLYWKTPVRVASTTNIVTSAFDTTLGTLTFNAAGTHAIDGVILAQDNRVLIKDQDLARDNGIYTVTVDGSSAGTTVILTRALDANSVTELDAAAVFVKEGVEQSDVGFVQTAQIANVGVSSITFVQFTGAGSLTAGDGISIIGNQISVDTDGGGALDFVTGELAITLDGATLSQSGGGIKVADLGIDAAQIANNAVGLSKVAFSYQLQSQTISGSGTANIEITRAIESTNFQSPQSFRVSRNGQLLRASAAITTGTDNSGTFAGTYGTVVAGQTVTIKFDGVLEDGDEIDIVYLD